QPLKYAGVKAADKIQCIRKNAIDARAGALLITAPDSLCWLRNIRGNDVPHTPFLNAHALLFADGRLQMFCAKEKIPASLKKTLGNKVSIKPALDAKSLKQRTILADPATTPVYYSGLFKITEGKDPIQLAK